MRALNHFIVLLSLFFAGFSSLVLGQETSESAKEQPSDEVLIKAGLEFLEQEQFAEAQRNFQTVFDGGNGDGAFYLGRMLEVGITSDAPDLRSAAELYQAGVDRGSALAMNRLGIMYHEGTAVLQDYEKAVSLICGAADLKESNAAFNCGAIYAEGRIVEQDLSQAVKYWKLAANDNHMAALNYLGQAYMNGLGVDASPEESRKYFMRTAEMGNGMGLYEIGKFFSRDADDADKADEKSEAQIKAYMYLNLAADAGHPDAVITRDELSAGMDLPQIREAQKQSRKWKDENTQTSASL